MLTCRRVACVRPATTLLRAWRSAVPHIGVTVTWAVTNAADVDASCGGSLTMARRGMNVSRSVQTRWELDNMTVSEKRTDYDFDKEQWAKQMRMASMECIMDPDLSPPRYTSLSGLRRAVRRFVTMRKLKDRRPDFDVQHLQSIFVQLKRIAHDKNVDHSKTLQRLTTHGEAARITREIRARMNADFATKSWKALKQQDAANTYEIVVDAFDFVNCYMGTMSQDDWLQLTYRCTFRERESAACEWAAVVEYPVFEVRLSDGVRSANNYPFIVVGVMRKDGTRYGKDAQDAEQLRRQFERARRWF